MADEAKLELERGSGNVFRDFDYAEADVHHAKGKLAAASSANSMNRT